MAIKLIAYDLDNTLLDSHGQLGHFIEPMVDRMKPVGLTSEQEKQLRKGFLFTSYSVIARQAGFSKKVTEAGLEAFKRMDFTGIKPFDDIEVVRELKAKRIYQVLVTSGITAVQEKKILALGIRGLFDEVIIEDSDDIDGKKRIFSDLICEFDLEKDEILIVGDNPLSELASGKKLGMKTVQIIRSSWIKKGPADYHIQSLRELLPILKKL